MLLQRPARPGEGPGIADRLGREGIAETTGDDVTVPTPRVDYAHLTSREIMAAVRARLAARGFDWSDALWTGRRPAPAGPEAKR